MAPDSKDHDTAAGSAGEDQQLGLWLQYASAALEWVQTPAVYALFRIWLDGNPDTEVLSRPQLKMAEMTVTALGLRLLGATEEELRGAMGLPAVNQSGADDGSRQ